MRTLISRTAEGKFRQTIEVGPHRLTADEPVDVGGEDAGPTPHELLRAALATCTSMTIKMYADRKGWPLSSVEVSVDLERGADGAVLRRVISLHGELDDDQRARLLDIAGKCPVHKTLSSLRIESALG